MNCKLTVEQLQEKLRQLENEIDAKVRLFLTETGVPECQLKVHFGAATFGPTGGHMTETYMTTASVNL